MVSLIDLYPTLAALCGLQVEHKLDGVSLASVLKNPREAQDREVLLPHMQRGSYAVINQQWRYIYYQDGSEELYDLRSDPDEWHNLMGDKTYGSVVEKMKKVAPRVFAPVATDEKELKLVIEGDTFHWEEKSD